MLDILKGIDTVIKLSQTVRMCLLALVVILLCSGVYLSFLSFYRKGEIEKLTEKVSSAESRLDMQNQKIKALAEETAKKQRVMDDAVSRANDISKENENLIDSLNKIELRGSCEEKVAQSLSALRGIK